MTRPPIRLISNITSLVLFGYWLFLLTQMNAYSPDGSPLLSEADVDTYLQSMVKDGPSVKDTKRAKIGLFIQSIEFVELNEVSLTGYLWQKVKLSEADSNDNSVSFTFPQQTNLSAGTVKMMYQRIQDEYLLSGWFVDVALRQSFITKNYPFDNQTISIQITPSELLPQLVFEPDTDSYNSMAPDSMPGLDDYITLDGRQIKGSYFDYVTKAYETNFGMGNSTKTRRPNLTFNIELQRRFISAFTANFTPIFLLLAMLFIALKRVGSPHPSASRHDFTTTTIIGTCISVLAIFVAMHVNIKGAVNSAQSNQFFYLEYFYFLVYLLLIAVCVNALSANTWLSRFLHGKDNLVLETCYWPSVALYSIVITHIFI